MIIERIKSIALLILVSLSLYLTYQLWYSQKPVHLVAEEAYEKVITEKPRLLEEAITPNQIVLRTDLGQYRLKEDSSGFNMLWENISQLMQTINTGSMADENMPPENARRMLTIYLKPGLPIGEGFPWLPEYPQKTISGLEFYNLNSQLWLVMKDSDTDFTASILLPQEKAEMLALTATKTAAEQEYLFFALTNDRIAGLTDRELSITEPIYVSQGPVYMETLFLKPEIIERDTILKTFFIDYSLVRVIEEKDGGLIYTDGERGLRITDTSLEYSSPRLETGQTNISYQDALTNSINLISYHGGWPQDLRLEDLTIIGRGRSAPYAAEWRMYYRGYPLFTQKPTRAIFNDRGLIHYTRMLFTVGDLTTKDENRKPVAEWERALQAAVLGAEALQPAMPADLKLEAMELGYIINRHANAYRGDPVWFVQLNGFKVLLDAFSLDLLGGEDLQ